MANNTQLLKGLIDGIILKIINDNETYGYEIYVKVKGLGLSDFAEGSLYPLLLRLEKKGFINTGSTWKYRNDVVSKSLGQPPLTGF